MKRASLSVRPAAPKAEPADLTDRLLERESGPAAPAPPQKRPGAARAKQQARAARPPEPETPAPVLEASTTDEYAPLDAALAQAAGAAGALEDAARQAPARYDVALRYRLDALAHHLRQVADFVGNLTRR